MPASDLGRIATRGTTFRARAEERQREYRVNVLQAGWSEWGHWLDGEAEEAGANFVTSASCAAARERQVVGKGVGTRTFQNMLSSQAMCFNLFAPLAGDPELATAVLALMIPGLAQVRRIEFEYTPEHDVFGDRTGHGGVDCDLLIEATLRDGENAIIVVETKFVEPDFSSCGFARSGRAAAGRAICPNDVPVRDNPGACLYVSRKRYRYWERTLEHSNLAPGHLPEVGCPFRGRLWQLWVNHTLAHVVAERRGARHARFVVCAPRANQALLRGGAVLEEFRGLLTDPETLLFMDVDELIGAIKNASSEPGHGPWQNGLVARYSDI